MGGEDRKEKARMVVPSESREGVLYDVVLYSDGSTECVCEGWKRTQKCKHIRACYADWARAGLVGPEGAVRIGTDAAPAQVASEAAPTKPPVESWRAATPEEVRKWQYAKKGSLPPYVRKVPTGEKETGKDGGVYPVMRVEILGGSAADSKPGASVPATVAPNGRGTTQARSLVPSLEDFTALTEFDFYPVDRYNRRTRQYEKREEPSSKAVNKWAGDAGISTEYVRDREGKPVVGCDATKAWAVVRGRLGSLVREASVTLVFSTEEARLTIDRLNDRAKAIKDARAKGQAEPPMIEFALDERTGLPFVTDPLEQIAIIAQAFRKRTFGEREATTKAERIVQRKLLGAEFQDPEEVEAEHREVLAVASAQNADAPPPVEPKPQTGTASAVAQRFGAPTK